MKRADRDVWSLLRLQVRDWGITLTDQQILLLEQYVELLSTYEAANVIGTRDRETIVLEHLLDSLSCFLASRVDPQTTLVDVGTGGGLPGIPIGVACEGLSLVLLEATEKKARFLSEAVRRLGLSSAEIINQRVEEVGQSTDRRDSFDLAVVRAVASLPVVVEYCAPLVKPGGVIVAMKGRLGKEELSAGQRAANALRAALAGTHEVRFLPQVPQKERRLIVFQKVGSTPEGYPRRVGLAKKRPLGGTGNH